jgi:hypothetical protein
MPLVLVLELLVLLALLALVLACQLSQRLPLQPLLWLCSQQSG